MNSKADKYSSKFSRETAGLFLKISQYSWKRPAESLRWMKVFRTQLGKHRQRMRMMRDGHPVPPVMICSITSRCNLSCKGCYASAQNRSCNTELSEARYSGIFREASSLGTGIVILAGGEPLMRRELLEKAAGVKDVIFPVFTNGTMLRNGNVELFHDHRNLLPVLSLEGNPGVTDERRGSGVHARVSEAISSLREKNVLYGISVTLTSENFNEVLSPAFINEYWEKECSLFFFVEYVPEGPEDISLCLTEKQKQRLQSLIINLQLIFPAVFLSLPGDEERFGGCLAAGRGFAHVSSNGDLEACPFAPYSDINLAGHTLAEGLRSGLMKTLREKHHLLGEREGGCTLWTNREWVEKQLTQESSARERVLRKLELTEAS